MKTSASKMRLPLVRQIRIGLMAAVLCITSQWSIPVGSMPMTLQTFFVPLAGALLGGVEGALAVGIYLLLGVVGLPVFSGFQGGVARLIGPTGGFLWTFPLMALMCGLFWGRSIRIQMGVGLSSVPVLYTVGTIQLMIVAQVPFGAALAMAAVPLLLVKDIICVICAIALGRLIKERIGKYA